MAKIGVIIPTWNNNDYLGPCLNSLLNPLMTEDMIHVYLVNNGDPANVEQIVHPRITVLQQTKNEGWEGGLKAGLAVAKEQFICFLNDDTYVPMTSLRWVNRLLEHFKHPQVGAVGPSSNVVMGIQNIFSGLSPVHTPIQVNYLIGFCLLVRRSALEAAGGIDDSLPGGDDLDLSIRLRKAGYVLLADREVFIYHHGFKTGERVEGGPNQKNGWNSVEKTERTNWALMEKHGLYSWMACMNQLASDLENPELLNWTTEDTEGQTIANSIRGEKVLEVGCGMKKTVPWAVGVDRIPNGESIPGVAPELRSVADIVANAEGPIPVDDGSFDTIISRHVLEHIVHDVDAVREWGRILKHGGRLIIAVPNHEIRNTIPMNHEHVRAWTPKSMQTFMESQGWKVIDMLDPKNNVSFVAVLEKNGLH